MVPQDTTASERREDDTPNKAEREGYSEAPFFYHDPTHATARMVAWAGPAGKQEQLFWTLAAVVGPRISYLFKEHFATEGKTLVWHRHAGGILLDDLKKVIEADRSFFFHDSGFQLCLRNPDSGDYFAYDEHGLFWIYSADPRYLDALLACGLAQRKAALISDKPHWHVRPKDAGTRLAGLVEQLRTRSQFHHEQDGASPSPKSGRSS